MAEAPWLTILGLGEDGPAGLPPASAAALAAAEVIIGPPRHLSLIDTNAETIPWPVPFADGIDRLLTLRGRRAVALVSGDPFWFGAGTVLARHLAPGEWRALPGPSCFALVAARLGWALERATCLGLHAAPLARLRPHLAPGARLIVTLRDGAAVADLAAYLEAVGFGASTLTICEALGGPREAITRAKARALPERACQHPVCAAIAVDGDGPVITAAAGRADSLFENDGQMTKRPMRALTLSALAPRPGERLWDVGGGSGSIALEWLLAHPAMHATAIERRPDRADRIRRNAEAMGLDHLEVAEGAAPEALAGLPPAQAVFVGGGFSADLLAALQGLCAPGTRLVVNAVTLEAQALLTGAQARLGGDLMQIALAQAAPLGAGQTWRAALPIVQWRTAL